MTLNPNSSSSANGAPAIRIVDLCRHYQMGEALIRAVDGVSLQIQPGEFVALLGSSGSGKSSLLNLIAGLDRPTSGAVIVEDRDLAQLSREELAKHRLRTVGMVFQSFNLVSRMTLAENVDLPLRFAEVDRGQRQALTRQALERVGLGARMTHRPSELSGGEQQRAALARALDQSTQASAGGRTHRQSRQPHRHRDHEFHPRIQPIFGDDHRDGDPRAGPGRALCQAHDPAG